MRLRPSELPPTVRQLGWISFWADVCSELVYPVLPLFLRGTLKVPVEVISLIEGIAESLVSFMKGWSGFRSDRLGQRLPFIRWGYALSAIGKPMIGLAVAWPMVLGARTFDRFGKGLRTTARDAMIADAVQPSAYGVAFGFHRAMDTAGAFVGVLLCLGLLAILPGQYRLIFLAAFVPGVLSVILTLRLRESARRPAPASTEAPRPSVRETVRAVPPRYWGALAVSSVLAVANTSDTFLFLQAQALGLSDHAIISAYLLYNLVVAALATWAGRLSDQLGRWAVFGSGWIVFAGAYGLFALGKAPLVWAGFGLYGLSYALTQGVGRALVADYAPAHVRGGAIGLFSMVVGFCTLIGNVAMGLVWRDFGASTAFLAAAGLALVGAAFIPFVARRPAVRA